MMLKWSTSRVLAVAGGANRRTTLMKNDLFTTLTSSSSLRKQQHHAPMIHTTVSSYTTNVQQQQQQNKPTSSIFLTRPAAAQSHKDSSTNVVVQSAPIGIPRPALILSTAGLIPIAAPHILPDFLVNAYMETIVHAQITYAAALLPFLGAIHFGIAVAYYFRGSSSTSKQGRTAVHDRIQYSSSMIPFFISWAALNTADQPTTLWLLMGGYVFALGLDFFAYGARLTPGWYLFLRMPLTLLVLYCLYLTYVNFTKEKVIVAEDSQLINSLTSDEGDKLIIKPKDSDTSTDSDLDMKPAIAIDVKRPSEHPKKTIFVHGDIPEDKEDEEEEEEE